MLEPQFTQTLFAAVTKVYAMDPTAVDTLNEIDLNDLTDVQAFAISNAEQAMTDRASNDMEFLAFIRDHLDGTQAAIDTDYILSYVYLSTAYPAPTPDKIAAAKAWGSAKRFKTAAKSLSVYTVLGNLGIAKRDGDTIQYALDIINDINTNGNQVPVA